MFSYRPLLDCHVLIVFGTQCKVCRPSLLYFSNHLLIYPPPTYKYYPRQYFFNTLNMCIFHYVRFQASHSFKITLKYWYFLSYVMCPYFLVIYSKTVFNFFSYSKKILGACSPSYFISLKIGKYLRKWTHYGLIYSVRKVTVFVSWKGTKVYYIP